MKEFLFSLIIYIFICYLVLFIPASEGYNSFAWKLLIGQIYALPTSILFFYILNKGNKKTK